MTLFDMMHRVAAAPMRGLRPSLLMTLLASLLLSGCFTSTAPKFPVSESASALGDGGRYVAYQRQSDGSFKREDPFTVRKRAGGGYDFVDADGKVLGLSLHRIKQDLYVAQEIAESGRSTNYVVLRVRGGEVLSYNPDCAKQDAAKMKSLGVELKDEGKVCAIDGVADPAALFAGLDLGKPTSKMVRE
jgi:hypothetical protein